MNGLGLSIAGTERYVQKLIRIFTVVHDSLQTFQAWHKLVVENSVIGTKVHDARLIAVMMVNGISGVLMFNTKDFTRYDGIIVIQPDKVTSA